MGLETSHSFEIQKSYTRVLNLLLVVQYKGPSHDTRTGKTALNSLRTYGSPNNR